MRVRRMGGTDIGYPSEERNNILVIIACMLSSFIVTYSFMSISNEISQIEAYFSIDNNSSMWLQFAPLTTIVAFVTVATLLMQKYGKKFTLQLGLGILLVSSVASMLTDNFFLFVLLRVIIGAGMSFIYVSTTTLLTDATTCDRRDLTMSFFAAFSNLGSLSGPLLFLIWPDIPWKVLILIMIPMVVLALYLLREGDNIALNPGCRINPKMHILFIAGLLLMLNGFMEINEPYGLPWVFIGAFLLFLMVVVGKRSNESIFKLELLTKNKMFRYGVLASLFFFLGTYTTSHVAIAFLQVPNDSGTSYAEYAAIWTVTNSVMQCLFSPVFGKFNFKENKVILPTASMMVMIVSIAMWALIDPGSEYFVEIVIASAILNGIGSAGFTGNNTSRVMSSVAVEDRDHASAILNFIRQFVRYMGILAIFLLTFISTDKSIYAAYLDSIHVIFSIMVVLSILGTYFCIKGPKELRN